MRCADLGWALLFLMLGGWELWDHCLWGAFWLVLALLFAVDAKR